MALLFAPLLGIGQHREFGQARQAMRAARLSFGLDWLPWQRERRECAAKEEPSIMKTVFDTGLDRNEANYTPLTPLSLIARTAYTYPKAIAVIHGERRYTWA